MTSSISERDISRFNEGAVIFAEGDPSEHLYIVKTGRIRIVKEAGDRIIPITIINEKEFLGEMSMFGEGPRSATAIALENTELVQIKKSEIKEQLNLCADWVTKILKTISDRLRSADDIIRENKIIDDRLSHGNALTSQEENKIKTMIADYRQAKS